jgi:RNA recognition motif-containing protein
VSEQENKIYVGNIEFSVTDEELKRFFEEKGMQVKEATIIKDRYTGRSKGFGFVEMASGDEVENAIQSLDGQELSGRKLKISKARKPKNDKFRR